jgi:ASC-1-like (ASCH) protein
MNLDTIYFDYIKNKTKLYETRVYDKKRQSFKLLDIIKIKDRGSQRCFKVKIIELAYFNSFKSAIASVGIKKVLPNAKSLKEGVKIYEEFSHGEGGTYKNQAKKYGVLRIKFHLL